jgi:hypothetical protein
MPNYIGGSKVNMFSGTKLKPMDLLTNIEFNASTEPADITKYWFKCARPDKITIKHIEALNKTVDETFSTVTLNDNSTSGFYIRSICYAEGILYAVVELKSNRGRYLYSYNGTSWSDTGVQYWATRGENDIITAEQLYYIGGYLYASYVYATLDVTTYTIVARICKIHIPSLVRTVYSMSGTYASISLSNLLRAKTVLFYNHTKILICMRSVSNNGFAIFDFSTDDFDTTTSSSGIIESVDIMYDEFYIDRSSTTFIVKEFTTVYTGADTLYSSGSLGTAGGYVIPIYVDTENTLVYLVNHTSKIVYKVDYTLDTKSVITTLSALGLGIEDYIDETAGYFYSTAYNPTTNTMITISVNPVVSASSDKALVHNMYITIPESEMEIYINNSTGEEIEINNNNDVVLDLKVASVKLGNSSNIGEAVEVYTYNVPTSEWLKLL